MVGRGEDNARSDSGVGSIGPPVLVGKATVDEVEWGSDGDCHDEGKDELKSDKNKPNLGLSGHNKSGFIRRNPFGFASQRRAAMIVNIHSPRACTW